MYSHIDAPLILGIMAVIRQHPKKAALCSNLSEVFIWLTYGCHHNYGALEVIIGRHIKAVLVIANKRPSAYLISCYVNNISIHGAHCQNGHNDSNHYEQHVEACTNRLEAGGTEKPAAAVVIVSKA